jgi:hypothetical protein
MTVIGPVPITPDAPGVPTAASVAAQVAIPSGPISQSMMAPAPPMPAPPVMMPPATMPPTQMPMPGGAAVPPPVPFALAPTLPMQPTPAVVMPVAPSGLPTLVTDDISYVGAKPLVTDPKLGWSTSVNLPSAIDGTSTRLASGQTPIDYRIQSNTRWVVLAILLLLVVIGMIVLIITT